MTHPLIDVAPSRPASDSAHPAPTAADSSASDSLAHLLAHGLPALAQRLDSPR